MRKEEILEKLRHAQKMIDECEEHIGDGNEMMKILDEHGAERFSKEEIEWLIRWLRWTMDVMRLENMLKGLQF